MADAATSGAAISRGPPAPSYALTGRASPGSTGRPPEARLRAWPSRSHKDKMRLPVGSSSVRACGSPPALHLGVRAPNAGGSKTTPPSAWWARGSRTVRSFPRAATGRGAATAPDSPFVFSWRGLHRLRRRSEWSFPTSY